MLEEIAGRMVHIRNYAFGSLTTLSWYKLDGREIITCDSRRSKFNELIVCLQTFAFPYQTLMDLVSMFSITAQYNFDNLLTSDELIRRRENNRCCAFITRWSVFEDHFRSLEIRTPKEVKMGSIFHFGVVDEQRAYFWRFCQTSIIVS